MLHADNCNHSSYVQRQVADTSREALSNGLKAFGLVTHEVVEATELANSLSIRVDGLSHEASPAPERDVRLDAARVAICDGRCVSGDDAAIARGHVTMRCMLHRCLFSIFGPRMITFRPLVPGMPPLWPGACR